MSRTWTPSNGVRSRRSIVSRSTSYSRQFSSPPVSCTYSRCLPSLAQVYARMPRSRSSVTTAAASQSTPEPSGASAARIGATQTLSTPSRGAIQAIRVPSGEMFGLMRSGLPKSTLRGMSSTMTSCLPHHLKHPELPRVAGPQPGEVIGDRAVRVVGGLVARVLAEPADVEADPLAGSGRTGALGQFDPCVRDEPADGGRDLPVGHHPPGGDVIGPVIQPRR